MIQNLIIALLVGMLLMQVTNASMVGLAGASTRSAANNYTVRVLVNWPAYQCSGRSDNWNTQTCQPVAR